MKRTWYAPGATWGPRVPPAAHEAGWKDVVTVPPAHVPGDPTENLNFGQVTRIIARFELPHGLAAPPAGLPPYVWHCHILEHEEHDMMRPLVVR